MIIYNFKKEFLGIDEQDLQSLGYTNLQQLLDEASDFADLFVKTPGFIHNFEHIHWIDYIEDIDNARAIIEAKNKKYTCGLELNSIYLKDDPTQKAYQINLVHLRPSSGSVDEIAPAPSSEKPVLKTQTQPKEKEHVEKTIQIEEVAKEEIVQNEIPIESAVPPEIDIQEPAIETPEKSEVTNTEIKDEALDLQIEFEDLSPEDTEDTSPQIAEVDNNPIVNNTPQEETLIEEEDDDKEFDNSYIYDPHVASDALGLPVDLIEEFIEDFIAQAQEFRAGLYSSLEELDYDNLKKLAHKLKGVAANLRIEDAFEVLVVLNNSRDYDEVKTHLNRLYKIITKLSKQESVPKEVPTKIESVATTPKVEVEEEDDDDDLILTFKDEDEYVSKQEAQKEQVEQSIAKDDSNETEDEDFFINLEDDDKPSK